MAIYYRCLATNFMWKEGAIISAENQGGHYRAVESFWDQVPLRSEYISGHIIEHPDNAIFFERVYKDTLMGTIYKTKDQMIDLYNKFKK